MKSRILSFLPGLTCMVSPVKQASCHIMKGPSSIHPLDTITDKHLASLPTLFQVNGTDILLTESDIDDYPGMWITGAGQGKISGTWSNYPDTEKLRW